VKIVIIIPKCRKEPTSYPPYGAVYIGTWLKQNGYEVELLNLDINRICNKEVIEHITKLKPDVVGFSAIVSTSYGYVKELTFALKKYSADLKIIMGGQLSNAANVVLSSMPMDVVVIGEGELTTVNLLKAFQNDQNLQEIPGIAFKQGNEVIFTPPGSQVQNLDSLPDPDWDLINMDFYLVDPFERWGSFNITKNFDHRFTEKKRQGKKSFTIMTGRGCSDWCSFCCRNIKGLRKNSADRILDMMEHLIKKYNVGYFTFGDESFSSHKKWVLDFLKKLDERNLDILFYVLGARVDTIDKELLIALKKSGCFMIEYGFEHGSQRMLDLMEKRSTIAENLKAYWWTKEVGLFTVPANVINMPGETSETINETIKFLTSLDVKNMQFFVNYAQAHPGTPLYDYALLTGMIVDEDRYLTNLTDMDAADTREAIKNGVLLNFSGLPLEEVLSWEKRIKDGIEQKLIKSEGKLYYINKVILGAGFRHLKIILMRGPKYYFKNHIQNAVDKIGRIAKILNKPVQNHPQNQNNNEISNTEDAIDQYSLNNDAIIHKIKGFKFTSRQKKPHENNNWIDYYIDEYDKSKLIRHPSLREINNRILEESGTGKNRKLEMTDTKTRVRRTSKITL
jgi:anaerobic magnesium-protoporphyrin IX monomethyl ester cyclase